MKSNQLFFICFLSLSSLFSIESEGEGGEEAPIITRNLNSYQGIVLWEEPPKIVYETLYSYKGLTKFPIDISQGRKVTLSEVSLPRDCREICHGLHAHTVSCIGERDQELQKVLNFPSFEDSVVVVDPHHEILVISAEKVLGKLSVKTIASSLGDILTLAHQEGARKVFITLEVLKEGRGGDPTSIPEGLLLTEELITQGFKILGHARNLKKGGEQTLLAKDLKKQQDMATDVEGSYEWQEVPEVSEIDLSRLANKTGVFVRNNNDEVIGGIFGETILGGQFHPQFIEIDGFYMCPSIRGEGYGKKVIGFIEEFARENNAQFSRLATADFQAPWFYEKQGYSRVVTFPEIFKLKSGERSGLHEYRKRLF